jgi:uncharacterized protein (DUF58 family)
MSTVAASVARRQPALNQLELLITHKLDGLLHGDHQGLLHGAGTDAGDARLYQPGDDVRRIDWNLTARSNATHVRDTIADRELETWLLVDCSASLDFGTAACEKRDLAMAAAAAFGFLTARAGNRLAAICYDAGGARCFPPRTGRDAALGLLHQLDRRARSGEGAASLADALRRTRLVARRGLLVVVSDLLDDSDWPRELRAATARHDVVIAQICDPREAELPPVGLLTLVDPETGRRQEVQTASRRLRERYAAAATAQRLSVAKAVRTSGAAHLVLSTDRDWLHDVVKFAAARRRRR